MKFEILLDVARRQSAHGFEIGNHYLIEVSPEVAGPIDVVLEADGPFEAVAHRRPQFAPGGSQVQQGSARLGVALDEVDQNPMAAAFEVLERIDVRHGRGRVSDEGGRQKAEGRGQKGRREKAEGTR